MRKVLPIVLASVPALLIPSVAAGLATPGAGEFHWQGTLSPGKTIEIKGVNGAIDARAAGGDQVEVVARKHGRRSNPDEVEIKVVEHAAGVTICAVYPTPWGSRQNECTPGSGGHMSTRNNDVEVAFEVRVPKGVGFVGRTVNGGVDAVALPADAEAYTVNGGVRVEAEGEARAETVNGSIRAAMGRSDGSGTLALKTVNGSITVEMPASTNADVHAETVNGAIETDFPLTVQGKFSRRRLEGTIGGGGRRLELTTVNGGITLRKGP
jgi:hypothetical protein